MKKLEKEVARWRETIDDLDAQRANTAQRVDELKAKKRPLTLSAHTGDAAARKTLVALNTELMTATQDLQDIDEAIQQAETKVSESERAVAEARETERLRKLSELAELRVDAAAKIEKGLLELAVTLDDYQHLGTEIRRHLQPGDDTIFQRIDGSGRLDLVFGRALGEFVPCARMGRNPVDPRKDKALVEMEKDALNRLLITPNGAEKMAKMKAA